MLKVCYFAKVREDVGFGEELLVMSEKINNTDRLLEYMQSRGEPWNKVFSSGNKILLAVNHELSNTCMDLEDGDEVGYFPPVTGG